MNRNPTAPVGAAISRPRVDEDIDPYKPSKIPTAPCRGGSPSRPTAARPLRGRVDEDIDPYKPPKIPTAPVGADLRAARRPKAAARTGR